MSSGDKLSVVGDVRKLLQDIVTPDLKALAGEVAFIKEKLLAVEAQVQRLEDRQERRFERILSAIDVFKDVQELKEFRIRMEERQKPGEAAH